MVWDFPTFHTFQISLATGQTENSFFVDIELGWLLGRLSMYGMLRVFPCDTLKNFDEIPGNVIKFLEAAGNGVIRKKVIPQT